MALERKVIDVAFLDGTMKTFRMSPRVQTTFERKNGIGLLQALNDSNAEWAQNVHRLAWEAASDGNPNPTPFEQWIDTVDALEVRSEKVVPTVAAPAAGSPSSQSRPE